MKLEVLQEQKSPMLSRTEYKFKLLFQGATPSKDDVMKIMKEHFKENQENIVIKKIQNIFGRNEAMLDVYYYDNQESLQKLEPKPKPKEGEE
jgi:ribosomal protein S24E